MMAVVLSAILLVADYVGVFRQLRKDSLMMFTDSFD